MQTLYPLPTTNPALSSGLPGPWGDSKMVSSVLGLPFSHPTPSGIDASTGSIAGKNLSSGRPLGV